MMYIYFYRITPVGAASLIAVSIGGISGITSVFEDLGIFVATVTVGVAVHQLIILPIILFIFTRRNPYLFLTTIIRPWMIAFTTTSRSVKV